MKVTAKRLLAVLVVSVVSFSSSIQAHAETSGSPQDILKQGLMGAAVGGISSGTSGGSWSKGALIGGARRIVRKYDAHGNLVSKEEFVN